MSSASVSLLGVRERPEGNANATLATGEIEVEAEDIEVLNSSARFRSRYLSMPKMAAR